MTSRASCSGSVASWSRDCILSRAGSSGPLRCLSQCKCICLSRVLSALAAHLPMMSVFSAAPCNHSHCYLVNNIPQDVESCLTSTVSMSTASSSCSLSPSNQATINANTCKISGTKAHPGCYYTLRAYYQDHMQHSCASNCRPGNTHQLLTTKCDACIGGTTLQGLHLKALHF